MSRRAPTRAPLLLVTTMTLAATLGGVATPAAAKVTIQGTGTVTGGWSDNILNAPDEKTAAGAARESFFFFQLVPGGVLSSASPRFLQRLAYTFTADLFVHHTEANSYSNTLEWAADVALSK